MTTTNPAKQTPLSLLCLGDSLTAGYSQYGLTLTPYSKALLSQLRVRWPEGTRDIKVDTDGVSGDRVIGGFGERLRGHFPTPSTRPYTHVLLLGGTNDLGLGVPVQNICDIIEQLVTFCLSQEAEVLLFTIPECEVKSSRLDGRREEVNAFIWGEGRREGVHIFDLKSKMPYHDMDEEDREVYWDDGLHFTEAGYQAIGEAVAERLIEIIEAQESGQAKEEGEARS